MKRSIVHVALVVADYDEAIAFYCDILGFELIADEAQPEEDKRWVLVSPSGGEGASILLAKARDEHQAGFVGNQAGGRVFLFLQTDDFDRDFANLLRHEVEIIRPPKDAPYGRVAVFADLYGNLWDLVEFT